jgi:hypothetical protein
MLLAKAADAAASISTTRQDKVQCAGCKWRDGDTKENGTTGYTNPLCRIKGLQM